MRIYRQSGTLMSERPGLVRLSERVILDDPRFPPSFADAINAAASLHLVPQSARIVTVAIRDLTEQSLPAFDPLRNGVWGHFSRIESRILVSPRSGIPHLTLIHELGHYLEGLAVAEGGERGIADRFPHISCALRESSWLTRASRAVASHERNGRDHQALLVRYLARLSEVWARGYAQFVTMESTHDALTAELDFMLGIPPTEVKLAALLAPARFRAVPDSDTRGAARPGLVAPVGVASPNRCFQRSAPWRPDCR